MTHEERCGESLIVLLRVERNYDEETVIRWCPLCGAIVGDIDVDGRTAPGAVFPMQFPFPREGKAKYIEIAKAVVLDFRGKASATSDQMLQDEYLALAAGANEVVEKLSQ